MYVCHVVQRQQQATNIVADADVNADGSTVFVVSGDQTKAWRFFYKCALFLMGAGWNENECELKRPSWKNFGKFGFLGASGSDEQIALNCRIVNYL